MIDQNSFEDFGDLQGDINVLGQDKFELISDDWPKTALKCEAGLETFLWINFEIVEINCRS